MLNAIRPYNTRLVQSVSDGYKRHLMQRERARMSEYIKAREYYDGVHHTQLTDRAQQYLRVDADADFTVNYCPMVVNAKADRLSVSSFDTDDNQSETLWKWWRRNRMDRVQGIVHRGAVRDGDSFVLVEWDDTANIPRFYHEPAYAGDGVMVYYSDERRDDIEMASKHWRINKGPHIGKQRRLNLYLPDRIEKYISHDDTLAGRWLPYLDDEDTIELPGKLGIAGVVWWTDSGAEGGQPLGIPIVHFKHNDTGDSFGTSHLAKVMPVQDALNKAMIDLLGAMDTAGFGLLVGYGTDEWTSVKVAPGAVVSINAKPDQASLERLAGENPSGLLAVYNALVMEIARISGTPLSYFQTSGQVAAEGTMKQQEIALIAQVKKSQVDFGNSWEDVLTIARRLHNAFSDDPALDDDVLIETVWEEAETRNDKEHIETLVMKVENLGVSEEQAQIEMGYDDTQIRAFARASLRRRALATRAGPLLQLPPNGTSDSADTLTQTENDAGESANGLAA